MSWIYEQDFEVREYECDLQGIVNNAVYQNYLEHTRNSFLKQKGPDLKALHDQGIDAVVARIEIDYKFPLRAGDEFICRLNVRREGELKLVFKQEIILKENERLCARANVIIVCIENGRVCMPQVILDSFKEILEPKN
ncbi:MAG: acyl-CoA thioesterase [Spirochaetes bacterium]|jgi:acyl-CoA thioester hydrolase|nr:acyl-CoA thioesterase [Spirochaetota bacterium]